jgi:hypothetical protein
MLFNAAQQYAIIRDLCNLEAQRSRDAVKKLELSLIARYGHLASEALSSELDSALVERTQHWL